jgi:hypothetical protein
LAEFPPGEWKGARGLPFEERELYPDFFCAQEKIFHSCEDVREGTSVEVFGIRRVPSATSFAVFTDLFFGFW